VSYEVLLSDRLFCGLDEPITSQKSMVLTADSLGLFGKSRATISNSDSVDFLACCTNRTTC
jgi:hypothetical protein